MLQKINFKNKVFSKISQFIKNFNIDARVFVIFYSLVCTFFYSLSFWLTFFSLQSSLLVTIKIGLCFLFTCLFTYYTFLWIFSFYTKLFKPIVIVVTLINAVVLYYSLSYNIYIDEEMIANVLKTDANETRDLINTASIIYFLLFGVLPSIAIAKIKFKKPTKALKFYLNGYLYSLVFFVVAIFFILIFSKQVFTFCRVHKDLFLKQVPYNYIKSSIFYAKHKIKAKYQKPIVIEPNLSFVQRPNKAKPRVFFVVIGETARRDNFSLYGYHKKTNPLLQNLSPLLFKATSCGTNTNVSVPCIFYPFGQKSFRDKRLDVPYYTNFLSKLPDFDIVWYDNNFGGCYGVCDNIEHYYTQDQKDTKYCTNGQCTDGASLSQIKKRLANITKDTLIIFHQNGSHGPLYYKRYEQEFDKFNPSCKQNSPQNCTKQELINAYDNTILYTDYILNEVITYLKSYKNYDSAMLYTSDHGESLGEFGIYLHGFPYSIAPSYQKQVPLILWLSKNAELKYNRKCLVQKSEIEYDHSSVMNTTLGFFSIKSDYYDKNSDIFHSCFKK